VKQGFNGKVHGHQQQEFKRQIPVTINVHKSSRLVQRISRERGKYPVRFLTENLFPYSLQINALVEPSKTATANFSSIPHNSC
jgi:hypothetical protein